MAAAMPVALRAWWLAQDDPVVGPLLSLMHDQPEHPWTIEALATRFGYCRSTVARRFTDLVGQPPMTYLNDWRMTLAADLLTTTNGTVESVGRSVGYPNPFPFSMAFKRSHGTSPGPPEGRGLGEAARIDNDLHCSLGASRLSWCSGAQRSSR